LFLLIWTCFSNRNFYINWLWQWCIIWSSFLFFIFTLLPHLNNILFFFIWLLFQFLFFFQLFNLTLQIPILQFQLSNDLFLFLFIYKDCFSNLTHIIEFVNWFIVLCFVILFSFLLIWFINPIIIAYKFAIALGIYCCYLCVSRALSEAIRRGKVIFITFIFGIWALIFFNFWWRTINFGYFLAWVETIISWSIFNGFMCIRINIFLKLLNIWKGFLRFFGKSIWKFSNFWKSLSIF